MGLFDHWSTKFSKSNDISDESIYKISDSLKEVNNILLL